METGAPRRYGVTVKTADAAPLERQVGFRSFALVTGNDTDPEYVAASVNATGTSSHGMSLSPARMFLR